MPTVYSKVISEKVLAGLSDTELLKEIYGQLAELNASLAEPPVLHPIARKYNTSQNAGTLTPLVPEDLITSNLVFQNKGATGSGDIDIGDQTETAISIAPTYMLLYTFIGFSANLHEWYVKSTTANQPYGIMVFNP